jgi:seryl-tRNA synthetase
MITQEVVGRLEGRLMELCGKVEAVKEMDKVINEKVEAVKEESMDNNNEVVKEIKDAKENLSKVNKDVDEVKVMMSQMLEKFNMLELLSKLLSPTEGMFNTPREDILIAGGCRLCTQHSAEIFS